MNISGPTSPTPTAIVVIAMTLFSFTSIRLATSIDTDNGTHVADGLGVLALEKSHKTRPPLMPSACVLAAKYTAILKKKTAYIITPKTNLPSDVFSSSLPLRQYASTAVIITKSATSQICIDISDVAMRAEQIKTKHR